MSWGSSGEINLQSFFASFKQPEPVQLIRESRAQRRKRKDTSPMSGGEVLADRDGFSPCYLYP